MCKNWVEVAGDGCPQFCWYFLVVYGQFFCWHMDSAVAFRAEGNGVEHIECMPIDEFIFNRLPICGNFVVFTDEGHKAWDVMTIQIFFRIALNTLGSFMYFDPVVVGHACPYFFLNYQGSAVNIRFIHVPLYHRICFIKTQDLLYRSGFFASRCNVLKGKGMWWYVVVG